MNSSAIRQGAKYAAIVVLAALIILLAHLATGAGNKGHGPSPRSDRRVAEASTTATAAIEAKDAARPETPAQAASASSPLAVSPIVAPAKPRLAKAPEAIPPSSTAATPASADQHWEFIESFTPQMADHAEAVAPNASGAPTPEVARAAAEPPAPPAIASTIVTPAVAVAPVAIQHEAVQLDETPPPSTTAPLEEISVPTLSDEQLSGVGAASKDVAGSIESDLPGV